MLRTVFAKPDDLTTITMADSITTAEFKDALNRYPTVLESLAKPGTYLPD